ncbi:transmembrane protein 154 isoform X3 [Dicentrarchus labrax]|uniref:Transmembrane protein 154 n=1 Tax=Dicentrarchus labrax TaxID=13489 RepID=A0A8P4KQM3_DICLA|nr:transmembrane protein 154 isoform X3 [Dicentrarchus labrax]
MSASWSGSMRGPRVKTPLLLLLLLLLSALTQTVLCQDEEESTDPVEEEAEDSTQVLEDEAGPEYDGGTENTAEKTTEEDNGSGVSPTPDATPETDDPSVTDTSEESLSFIIILIPVVLVVLIISMIVCGIFINRRWNKKARNQELKQEDPYLDGCSTEKVPMPMFEEDVPSVLELEMEELDQWMKKDGETTEDTKHE